LQFGLEKLARVPRVGCEVVPFDDFEDFQRHGAAERRSPKVVACVPAPSRSAYLSRTQNAPIGNPPPSDFAIESASGKEVPDEPFESKLSVSVRIAPSVPPVSYPECLSPCLSPSDRDGVSRVGARGS
jgi:hypothetical protein